MTPPRALLTDLYELTMASSYHSREMKGPATFEVFVRRLPEERNFLVACGLERVLDYLEALRFTDEDLDYLGMLGMFPDRFLSYLERFRFEGEVWAVPEGEIVFRDEPILSVTAPLIDAQLIETVVLNSISTCTMLASKAARVALACDGRDYVDFSLRRTHGTDAGMIAARASFIAGAAATSNVQAAKEYGIDPSGTMAHSYVMAFADERAAFLAFARDFPNQAVLLVDTYDVEEGVRRAVDVARELAAEDNRIRAVRIDSGDLAAGSRNARKILDEAGFEDIEIFVSGDLDEYVVASLVANGVPIDGFGIGTQLGTSADAPWLGTAYKLVAYEGRPAIKLSSEKATLPCPKQVYRFGDRPIEKDMICSRDEEPPKGGHPLLARVMEGGRRSLDQEPIDAMRRRCLDGLDRLPAALRSLERSTHDYDVGLSPGLGEMVRQLRSRAY